MIDPEFSRLPYHRPPMTRGVDPMRMNWLWRLICKMSAMQPEEVVEALHDAAVPVDLRRVESWMIGEREPGYHSLSLAELERNLRALIELRELRANRPAEAPQPLSSPLLVELCGKGPPGRE